MCFAAKTQRQVRTLVSAAVVALIALGSSSADAQMPTVDPSGALAEPAAPPPQAAPAPQPPVIVNVPGAGGGAADGEDPEETGFYAEDPNADWSAKSPQWNTSRHGPVPEHHVVRKGDTLWDISWIYFNNPWVWPKVWSLNPTVTNLHWIYSGDMVRLYARGEEPVFIEDVGDPVDLTQPPAINYDVTLRHIAYVDRDKLKFAGVIEGSVAAKTLLSTGDHVYISYEEKPPKVGRRYAIYAEQEVVKHPKNKKKVGSYVRILGELTVVSVKKDKRARAVIEDAHDAIERGHLVGPLQRTYRGDNVELTPNEQNRQGVIVAMLTNDHLIGKGQVVFVDLGEEEGVKKGNLLHVVRRGDAYTKLMEPGHNVGLDDPKYPSRSVGRIVIVQVGKHASVGMVLSTELELGIGDFVLMRKSK